MTNKTASAIINLQTKKGERKMLYCVFNTDKEIIGRFKSHKKAIDYITDCNFNGIKTELKQLLG